MQTTPAQTSAKTSVTAARLSETERIAYNSLIHHAEGAADGGWYPVYLDNARPTGWSLSVWDGTLGSLEKKGLYQVDDGYAWGRVKVVL